MTTSSAQTASNRKSVPLSMVGKSMNLLMTLLLLGFFSWIFLLFLIGVSIFLFGWHGVWKVLQTDILAMTHHLWTTSISVGSVSELSNNPNLPAWLGWAFPRHSEVIATGVKNTTRAWITFLLVTQLIVERGHLFILGTLSVVSAGLIGFVDGLVKRDLRKFNNARESTLFFHRSKSLLSTLFFTAYFLFMVTPLPINPAFWIMSLALLVGLVICLAIQQFKKYL